MAPPKRQFKKRNFAKSVKNIVRKMSETKAYYTPLSMQPPAIASDGTAQDVVLIAQGTQNNQRVGGSVQLRHLKINGILTPGGTTQTTQYRVSLFYSTSTSATDFTIVDYLTGSYDPKVYFPLYDRYHRVAYDLVQDPASTDGVIQARGIPINISKKIRYYQKYTGANGSTLTRGRLIMVIGKANSTNTEIDYSFNGRVEAWFDDI